MSTRDAMLLAVTIGSGLIAGVFFAFSAFVMRALARLPASQGLAAMQSINVVVLNPLFLGIFLGTAVLSLALVGLAIARWSEPASAWVLAAGLLYLLGTFAITVVCNVPLNDALAGVLPSDADAASRWLDYVTRWTRWNHVRTLAAALAMLAAAVALRSGPTSDRTASAAGDRAVRDPAVSEASR